MTDSEHKWIETNNQVCGLLRMAHDALACSSLPPRRTWVGLTDEQKMALCKQFPDHLTFNAIHAIEAKLREKNGWENRVL